MFRPLLISMFLTSTALADTWTVDDDGKADFDNIQAAVDASSDGDEIVVMPGTYTSTQDGHVVNMLGKAVTLRSSDPSDPDVVAATIIDGENTRRGLACFNNETYKTIISGFTITNGFSVDFDYNGDGDIDWFEDGGGGISIHLSSPRIKHCVISYNTAARYGGGIYIHDANDEVLIESCVIANNLAEGTGPDSDWTTAGGGIFHMFGGLRMSDCLIENNESGRWGGGVSAEGNVSINNCSFRNNTGTIGGGLYLQGDRIVEGGTTAELTNCSFEDNFVSGLLDEVILSTGAGVMANAGVIVNVENCNFSNNVSENGFGGGVAIWDWGTDFGGSCEISNCIFSMNSAFVNGGAVSVGEPTSKERSSLSLRPSAITTQLIRTPSNRGTGIGFEMLIEQSQFCESMPNHIYGEWVDVGSNEFLDVCPDCPDINDDGYVNVTDLLAVIDQWGQTDSPADVTGDGVVNVSDLLLIISNWGPCE